ncbi:MAG: M20 family metallopeptidase [Candidatus Aenigmarchaeota archaeon]|nr:M20 family metallopeptidase [Candidatus Aenigmarchaeota archaeon]
MISFTQDLVKINSVYNNETKVCKLIKKKLTKYGIESKLVGEDKNRLNLIAKIEGTSHKKSLMFNGHTDTVAVGDVSKWKYDPFSGKFVNGKIYGRGSHDMKSGVAAIVFAAIGLVESKIKLNGDLILAFTSDEESGAHTGVKYLIKKTIKPNACIIAEPESKKMVIGNRGIYRFEITTKGRTAHTGKVDKEGINAVTKMAKVLLALGKIKPHYVKHKMFPPPKITPGTFVQGGVAINIVPDTCSALVDCRLSYGQTKKSIVADINKQLKKLKKKDRELSIKIRETAYSPPVIINKNEKIVKISSKNIKLIYGFKPKLIVSGAATDGNFLTAAGISTVVFGPEGNNAHSENEFVIANSIPKVSKVYALSAIDFLSVKK